MRQSTITAIRSYRIYLRDAENVLARSHEVDLASDEEARQRAALMLDQKTAYPSAEVWDRARLVCTVRRGRVSWPCTKRSVGRICLEYSSRFCAMRAASLQSSTAWRRRLASFSWASSPLNFTSEVRNQQPPVTMLGTI